jgi:uncharacterized protein (TIGR03435 family)
MLVRTVIIGLVTVVLCAQPQKRSPSFEVASVRLDAAMPTSFSQNPVRSGGKVTWTTTLAFLVGYAYQLHEWQLEGVPHEDFYTVQATFDEAANDADVRMMFRKLLAERFRLVTHMRKEQRSGYDLVVGKNVAKLTTTPGTPAAGKAAVAGQIFLGAGGQGTLAISGHGVPLSKLAEQLSDLLRVFVHDRTGTTQTYYFIFRFQAPDTIGGLGSESDAPTLFDALATELGLKLEKSKGPVDILVADHVDKVPSEN